MKIKLMGRTFTGSELFWLAVKTFPGFFGFIFIALPVLLFFFWHNPTPR